MAQQTLNGKRHIKKVRECHTDFRMKNKVFIIWLTLKESPTLTPERPAVDSEITSLTTACPSLPSINLTPRSVHPPSPTTHQVHQEHWELQWIYSGTIFLVNYQVLFSFLVLTMALLKKNIWPIVLVLHVIKTLSISSLITKLNIYNPCKLRRSLSWPYLRLLGWS